ncbi:MAG TPA: NAD(P)-binding domain-containing protein, partial [Polyangiales bacterium]|nr:NAD(P)-binding domain-containing protein [Polyangiales bacterium]
GYVVHAGGQRFEAEQVVIAIGNYQKPRLPAFASELAPNIVQLHSGQYRNPSQLQPGPVLIIGAGNSGAEIAHELSARHEVFIAGDNVAVPFDILSWLGRYVFVRLLMRVVFHRLLTVNNPLGRRARAKLLHGTTPLIRTKLTQLVAAGVKRVGRVAGTRAGRPLLDDGRVLDVANVVFCTGFDPDFSWIQLPICDASGEPQHASGIVERAPGLYFVGLHFLHAMSSGMIHGVGRDAARIARVIRQRAVNRPR